MVSSVARTVWKLCLVGPDVCTSQLVEVLELGVVLSEEVAEAAQVSLDGPDRRWPQTDRDLIQITVGCLGIDGRDACPSRDPDPRLG